MKDYLKRLGEWAVERMAEKSTYFGLSLLATTMAHHLPQEFLDVLEWWGPFLATGLIAASTKKP